MKYRSVLRAFVLGLALLALATLPQSASASVIGHLSFANCEGLGVVVTLTTVDWLPTGDGTGCIAAGIGTNVTFDTGSITPAEHGTLNDLAPSVGNTGFITFAGVTFDLASIGPGVSNTACVDTFNPSDPACSVFAGSPFVLTPGSTGTSVTFAVRGLANDADATSTNSPWSGAFTTQIAGVTPLTIQNAILATDGGSFQATYSFDGNVVGIPEPVSLTLIGFGLIAFAGLKRRKSRS